MNWYTPMPIKNGSVLMRVDVSSNGLGPFIPTKRCLFPSPRQGGRLWEGLPNLQIPQEARRREKEGLGWGGDWELWQEPRKPEPSLCPSAPAARFQVNINGFLQRQQDNTLHFTVGNEVRGPDSRETW